jgi:cell fate (sporulation/competence/biofilm development) regulator YlbF (YheA/YmcA/DUF963 family)
METTVENGVLLQKTQELCQAILDQPDFQAIRQRIDAFMADEGIKSQYQDLSDKGAMLQHKQQMGMMVNHEELLAFEKQRQDFLNNPVAQGFLDAQNAMLQVQDSVNRYVSKTFELGRLPNAEDFDHGSCGHGCGCSH